MTPAVPDLGADLAPRRVVVTERRILAPADVTAQVGGVAADGCDYHLRIIDLVSGHAFFVPMPHRIAENLSDQLDDLIGNTLDNTPNGGSSHE